MAQAQQRSKDQKGGEAPVPTDDNGDKPDQAQKVATVEEILERAPSDLVTETLHVPEWNANIRVRSLSAAQSARVKQAGLRFRGDETSVAWAEMEVMQFQEGVHDPSFKKDQVRQLYATSGKGFQRVINWLDEHSGIDKEELRRAREEFPGSGTNDEA